MEDDSRDAVSGDSLPRSPKIRRLAEPGYIRPCYPMRKKVGYKLMELFSLQFVDYEPVKLEQIYGIIILDCSADPYALFERLPGDPLPVDRDGYVKLTDPDVVHDAYDLTELHVFFFDLNEHAEKSIHEVWSGDRDECLLLCNKLLVKRRDTMIGPIELSFAVFTESLIAALEVKLLHWKDKGKSEGRIADHIDEIEVFGEITSRVKFLTDDRAKSYMFKREKEMCVLVRPGEAIPLSRYHTVCPIRSSSSLELHLALYGNSGDDDMILNRHVLIPANKGGDMEFDLESNYALVQLRITFTTKWY
ncbi:rRNA N-glycosidase [Rhynchospora pubera]|uniref:rRNA N-glycosidase n=1 Tax=Rhynchospora pubera TaxID=906938 RepID=A0AAV8F3P9_9POAL|nr:rRNA N-glycosidase [Rhynchospora pubera]